MSKCKHAHKGCMNQPTTCDQCIEYICQGAVVIDGSQVRAALREALTWMGQRTDDTEERRRIIAAGWAALEGR